MSDPTAEPTHNVTDDDYYNITSNETNTDDYSNSTISTDDSNDSFLQYFTTTNIIIATSILLFIIILIIVSYCYCCYKPSKNKNRTWLTWLSIPFLPIINLFNYCFYYDDKPFTTKTERFYSPPHYRAEKRFERNAPTDEALSLETSVDKFDYLITFPLVSGPYVSPVILKSDPHYSGAVITWNEIAKIWSDVITGSEEEKRNAIDELEQFFINRYGIENPSLQYQYKYKSWCVIAREAIIDRLSEYGCLQLKISANPKNIFVRIRTPMKLLESQADFLNYKLQCRGEIDPGSELFFNREINQTPVELEEEKKIYSKEEANMILSKLYRAGKISFKDASVNPLKETPIVWSRRVHVFERIADKVPIYNLFPPYMEFTITPHLRYMYQEYPSIRGNTLFLPKDRLYLTKSLIDRCINLEALMNNRLIKYCTALHDANRGENLTIDILHARWVYFWSINSYDVGSPYVSHDAYEKKCNIAFYLRPFSQPLKDIRNYFGEKIALFHAWNGFYIYYLTFPAVLGIIMEIIYAIRGYQDVTNNTDWFLQVFNVCIILWNTVYQKAWQRECKVIALKWGTDGYEKDEKNRPHFKGTKKRSLVNNQMELVFSHDERLFWMIFSTSFILCATFLNILLISTIFLLEAYLLQKFPNVNEYIIIWCISFLQALQIPIASYYFESFAIYINDTENHQTDTNYEDNLIVKNIFFQIISNFGALLFTAFGKKYLFTTRANECLNDLRILLIVIMIVRTIIYCFSLFYHWLKSCFRFFYYYCCCYCYWYNSSSSSSSSSHNNDEEDVYYNIADNANHSSTNNDDDDSNTTAVGVGSNSNGINEYTQLLSSVSNNNNNSSTNNTTTTNNNNNSNNTIDDDEYFLSETIDREVYKGVFDDYKSAVIEYGYINLFSVALPILPIIALVLDLVKLRTHAYQLCEHKRRPHVELSEDVGMWEELMNVMTIFGILISTGVIIFTTNEYNDTNYELQILYFLIHQQVLFLLKIIIGLFITIQPEWLMNIIQRQIYIIQKYAKSYSDDINDNDNDDDDDGSSSSSSSTSKSHNQNVLLKVNINNTREMERIHLLHIAQAYNTNNNNNNSNKRTHPHHHHHHHLITNKNILQKPIHKLNIEKYSTIRSIQSELRVFYKQLAYLQERYTYAQQNEIYNSVTGVSERVIPTGGSGGSQSGTNATAASGTSVVRVPIGVLTVKINELINTTSAMFQTSSSSSSILNNSNNNTNNTNNNSISINNSNDNTNNEVIEYKEDIVRIKVSFHPYITHNNTNSIANNATMSNNTTTNNSNSNTMIVDPVMLSLSPSNGYPINYSNNTRNNSNNSNNTTNYCLPTYTDDCLPPIFTTATATSGTSGHERRLHYRRYSSHATHSQNQSKSILCLPVSLNQCGDCTTASNNDHNINNIYNKSYTTNNTTNNTTILLPSSTYSFPSTDIQCEVSSSSSSSSSPSKQNNYQRNLPKTMNSPTTNPTTPNTTTIINPPLKFDETPLGPYVPVPTRSCYFLFDIISTQHSPSGQEDVLFTGYIDLARLPIEQEEVDMSIDMIPLLLSSSSSSDADAAITRGGRGEASRNNTITSNHNSNNNSSPDYINVDNNTTTTTNTTNNDTTNTANTSMRPVLKCLVEFKFSKLLMIQNKIFQLQQQIKQLEQSLAYIYSGTTTTTNDDEEEEEEEEEGGNNNQDDNNNNGN